MGVTPIYEQCAMKIKERNKEKMMYVKMEGRSLYWCYTKLL